MRLQKIVKWSWLALTTALVLILSDPWIDAAVHANALTQVTMSQAQRGAELTVSPIYGLNISFIPTGEVIRKIWLSDPSRVVLDTDTPLTAEVSSGQSAGGATVIRVRQLASPIPLDLKLPSQAEASASTSLTVVTTAGTTRKLYNFVLVLGSKSDYSTAVVVPDSVVARGPLTAAPVKPSSAPDSALPYDVAEGLTPLPTVSAQQNADPRVQRYHKGANLAWQAKAVSVDEYKILIQFFTLLQQGLTVEEATTQANVSVNLLGKLLQY